MQPDVRRLIYVQYALLHPQLARLEGNELAEFYALVHDLHPFESCSHHADSGGTIETEGWATVEVSREGFSYQERVREDFSLVQKRAVDVFALAKAHFEIPVYIVQAVKLRQIWPAPADGDMAQRLRDQALALKSEQYEPLGETVGAGIHVVGTGNDPFRHWHLELDPSHAETTSLYVQLLMHFAEPHEAADGLTDSLKCAYDFLEDNVTKFVMGFLS